MTRIFLIHGAYGNPEENWFPWLRKKLRKEGHEIIAPTFPTPEGQNLEAWEKVFLEYENMIDSETIFIGHSLAVPFILHILEKHAVKAAFFVSGFLHELGNKSFDSINKTFVEKEFDFDVIKNNCKSFSVYHSDNDPYVPLRFAYELAEKLDVKIKVVKGAGHFNSNACYVTFDVLLEDMKEII